MDPIVIATGNPHKVDELRAIFAEQGIPVLGLRDLPGKFREPDEHGKTFEENAAIKALSYATQTGRILSSPMTPDWEVDALGGAPGVISSHYSTNGVESGLTRAERDAANNALLLERLRDTPDGKRLARFVCVMALAKGSGDNQAPTVMATSRGTFEGRIGIPPAVPRGGNGFGYDPLFSAPRPGHPHQR
jgi:XTP/dITP diphosphohydrolase